MRKKQGSVAMLCLLAMAVLLISAVGAAGYAGQSMLRSQNEGNLAITYDMAQAALENAATQVMSDLNKNGGGIVTTTYDFSTTLSTAVPGVTATVTVQPDASGTYAYLTSTATYQGWTKSLRTKITQTNVSLWNNAIAAGCGASGQTIKGNCTIAGSVHILGDGEAFTDNYGTGVWQAGDPFNDVLGTGVYEGPNPSTSLADAMSGSSGIQNNYLGLASSMAALVPAAPTINGNQTLNANVRVKHGEVSLSGAATIGTSTITSGEKNTVDGTYVTDGFTGNQGAANVYSDNGTTHGYDLGTYGIEFPYISGIGSKTYTDSSGNSYTNEAAYLSAKALTCPVTTITASTAAFSYGPDANGNSISFKPANGNNQAILNVTGIVQFSGNLQIGAKDSIYFKGNGSLYDSGNINIDGNFLPANGQTFPTTTSIGLIAQKNINLATGNGSSQLNLAGAFYAQGEIVSQKQNTVMGTFVANFFDMGKNVPSIYQVPSLTQHMPPGMPGQNNIYIVHEKTWRQM